MRCFEVRARVWILGEERSRGKGCQSHHDTQDFKIFLKTFHGGCMNPWIRAFVPWSVQAIYRTICTSLSLFMTHTTRLSSAPIETRSLINIEGCFFKIPRSPCPETSGYIHSRVTRFGSTFGHVWSSNLHALELLDRPLIILNCRLGILQLLLLRKLDRLTNLFFETRFR